VAVCLVPDSSGAADVWGVVLDEVEHPAPRPVHLWHQTPDDPSIWPV
jgi:hypothetical protein